MMLISARRRAMFAATACLPLLAACAGTTAPAVNEFRKAGAGLACVTPDANARFHNPPYLSCLRIGPVRVGQPASDIKKKFGRPDKVVKQKDTTQLFYVIGKKTRHATYWVFGIRDKKIVAVQLTGRSSANGLAFSSIHLGDSPSRARQILGKPAIVQEVQRVGTEIWSYRPYPISIEIKGGRVYSMRVWRN